MGDVIEVVQTTNLVEVVTQSSVVEIISPAPTVLEIITAGPQGPPGGGIGAPVVPLPVGQSRPDGLPAGTVILRY